MENSETLQVVPTLIPFVLVIFVIALGVVLLNFQFRKNLFKKQLEKEELRQKHQQKLLENTVEIQEEERKRIAQDLHDELGAVLSISKMRLTQLERASGDNSDEIKAIKEHLETALSSTRRISRELMPVQLERLGLQKALMSLAHFNEETIRIEIDMPETDRLSNTQQLGLYRIFSELINNTLKYANASEIQISIQMEDAQLFSAYRDNGKGIDFDQFKSGIGFQSIDNRVSYLRGSWEYGNHPKGGFHADFILPLDTPTI